MIDINENDTEYLLSIPPSEKERAKTIRAYSWDSSRKVWVYPRTSKNFDALMAEFGDDLTKIKITRPSRLPENELDTKSKLDELTKRLEGIAKVGENAKDAQVRALQTSIQKHEKDTIALNDKIAVMSRELDAKSLDIGKLSAENLRLKNDLDAVISDSKKRQSELKSPTQVFEEVAKLLALELVEKNGLNAKAIQKLQLSETSAIDISKLLERILRKFLKADSATNLNELINQAKDAEILEASDHHLAHTIRVQRNMMAHPDDRTDESTFLVRSMMSFFNMALLIRTLEEHEKFAWASGSA